MEYTPQGQMFTDLVNLVFRANAALIATGNRLSEAQNLTISKWQVMSAIESDAMTVSDIARTIGLTRQSVQRSTDNLVADGMCKLMENPSHKTALLVQLTPLGLKRLRSMCKIQTSWANSISEQLSLKDMESTTKILKRIGEDLDKFGIEN